MKKSLTTNEIRYIGPKTNMYISEHLTRRQDNIAFRCRGLRAEGRIAKIWTSNGLVKVRVKDGDRAQDIKSEEDFEKLVSDLA